MIVHRWVTHGATNYARREYGCRNGEVYFTVTDRWFGTGPTPRAAFNDMVADRRGRYV